MRPDVVVLVPWRGGDPLREWTWAVVQPYLEALTFPILRCDRPGPWSRGAAINAGARSAGDWEVAVITDADTVLEQRAVGLAVQHVGYHGGAARPHNTRAMLTLAGSLALAYHGPEAAAWAVRRSFTGGGALVVARSAWDEVGGYDEEFVGWGHEDSAFNLRLLLGPGWDMLPGRAWHLWHPEANRALPGARANRHLMLALYQQHRAFIRAESQRRGYRLELFL